jgi:signal transduction histidine kinase
LTKNTILIIGDDGASTSLAAQALISHGFQVASLEALRLPARTVEALEGDSEILVISPQEINVRKLILHHLTNASWSLLGPVTTVDESVRTGQPDLLRILGELAPLMKEAAEQLHRDLERITGFEELPGPGVCNLLDAVRQAEKSYRAALADSDIRLTIKVNERVWVAAPAYLISLAISNTIDNAKDAMLEAAGHTSRELRIESDVDDDAVICHVINPGAMDAERVQHIFNGRYSTKRRGRGMGLQLVAECLAEYDAELTLTSPGPPETIFSFRFKRPLRVESAGSQ